MSDALIVLTMSAALTTFAGWAFYHAVHALRRAKHFRDEADLLMRRIEASLQLLEVRK